MSMCRLKIMVHCVCSVKLLHVSECCQAQTLAVDRSDDMLQTQEASPMIIPSHVIVRSGAMVVL